MYDEKTLARFWAKVKKYDGCWEWQAAIDRGGYGAFDKGKAHRISWEISFGSIPVKMCVCHKCDNRKCVRPEHLFLGTVRDNNDDRDNKKRQAIGTAFPHTKLTPQIVAYIRSVYRPYDKKFGATPLGRKYGVCNQAISSAANGEKWRHVR